MVAHALYLWLKQIVLAAVLAPGCWCVEAAHRCHATGGRHEHDGAVILVVVLAVAPEFLEEGTCNEQHRAACRMALTSNVSIGKLSSSPQYKLKSRFWIAKFVVFWANRKTCMSLTCISSGKHLMPTCTSKMQIMPFFRASAPTSNMSLHVECKSEAMAMAVMAMAVMTMASARACDSRCSDYGRDLQLLEQLFPTREVEQTD